MGDFYFWKACTVQRTWSGMSLRWRRRCHRGLTLFMLVCFFPLGFFLSAKEP